MALANFSLPFGSASASSMWNTLPINVPQQASAVNNLLYGPAGHQQPENSAYPPPGDHSNYYKNNPYAPPEQHNGNTDNNVNNRNGQYRAGRNNQYLPPPPPPPPQHAGQQPSYPQHHHPAQYPNTNSNSNDPNARSYGEGTYLHNPLGANHQGPPQTPFYSIDPRPAPPQLPGIGGGGSGSSITNGNSNNGQGGGAGGQATRNGGRFPDKPPGFVKVKPSSLTEIHPVLDYDDDQYYDDDDGGDLPGNYPGMDKFGLIMR